MPDFLVLLDSAAADDRVALKSALIEAIDETAPAATVKVATIDSLSPENSELGRDRLLIPLTLALPDWLEFPASGIYRVCRDIAQLRQRVAEWDWQVGDGRYWLPIVLTAKGALYAEAIAAHSESPSGSYVQPLHLNDRWRQPLYQQSYRLLQNLQAVPGVYLMQFGVQDEALVFDRLIPFPDVPALASRERQIPNLFVCHLRCLLNQPIHDLLVCAKAYDRLSS